MIEQQDLMSLLPDEIIKYILPFLLEKNRESNLLALLQTCKKMRNIILGDTNLKYYAPILHSFNELRILQENKKKAEETLRQANENLESKLPNLQENIKQRLKKLQYQEKEKLLSAKNQLIDIRKTLIDFESESDGNNSILLLIKDIENMPTSRYFKIKMSHKFLHALTVLMTVFYLVAISQIIDAQDKEDDQRFLGWLMAMTYSFVLDIIRHVMICGYSIYDEDYKAITTKKNYLQCPLDHLTKNHATRLSVIESTYPEDFANTKIENITELVTLLKEIYYRHPSKPSDLVIQCNDFIKIINHKLSICELSYNQELYFSTTKLHENISSFFSKSSGFFDSQKNKSDIKIEIIEDVIEQKNEALPLLSNTNYATYT